VTGPAPFTGAARLAEDTRRRFLATIVAHVPLERLVEVHLFPPIRQGGVETGVAVIAATRETESTTAESTTAESTTVESASAGAEAAEVPNAETMACDPTEDAASSEPAAPDAAAPDAEVPDAAVPDSEVIDSASPEPAAPIRHTVFTARYRVTIKGPDRGKWDADVVEEADAPLVTVEAVVRGVQRRAGDTADPDRFGPDVVARLLGVPSAPPRP
jgi:hypothetical protein